jgi:hypothetical protein
VFLFSLQIFSAIFFFILRRIKRDIIIHVLRYSCKVSVILLFLSDFIKFELCEQIFEKYSNINFYEYPSVESRVILC